MLRLLVSAAARLPFHPFLALLAALALASSVAEAAPDKAALLVDGRYEMAAVVSASSWSARALRCSPVCSACASASADAEPGC